MTNGNYAIIAQSFSGGAGGQFDLFARVFDGDTHAEVGSLSTIEFSNVSAQISFVGSTVGDVEAFNDGFIVASLLRVRIYEGIGAIHYSGVGDNG